MPIQFQCITCSKEIRTPDGTAGKRAACPYCGEVMSIPTQSEGPTSSPQSPPQSAQRTDKTQLAGDEGLAIEFPCTKCTRLVRAPASAVGKRCKCPSCGAVIQVSPPSANRSANQMEPTKPNIGTRKREQAAAQVDRTKPNVDTPQREQATAKPSSIEFACPACSKTVRIPASSAGKKGRCPKCGGVIQIPAAPKAKTVGGGQRPNRGSKPRGTAPAGFTPGLTPLSPSTPGLTLLPDTSPGLTPLGDTGGLTPLGGGGLTPLGDTGGLTPLGPAQSGPDLFSVDSAAANPFSDPLGGASVARPNPYQAPAYARRRPAAQSRGVVMAPAIAMMVMIGLSALLMIPYLLINNLRLMSGENHGPPGVNQEAWTGGYIMGTLAVTLVILAIYGLMFTGAWRMMRFQSWGLALTSAILMLMPCTICWMGLPIGIWAIVVLSLQSTRDQFT